MRRLAAVLDVTDTADAARLGVAFLVFQGLVVATTGWWTPRGHGHACGPGRGGPRPRGGAAWPHRACRGTAGPAAAWPRSRSSPSRMLACLTLGAPGTAAPYVGLLAMWFLFAGLATPAGTSLTLLMPAVSVYLLMLGDLDARHLVRGVLAGCTWVVIAEALAARTASAAAAPPPSCGRPRPTPSPACSTAGGSTRSSPTPHPATPWSWSTSTTSSSSTTATATLTATPCSSTSRACSARSCGPATSSPGSAARSSCWCCASRRHPRWRRPCSQRLR